MKVTSSTRIDDWLRARFAIALVPLLAAGCATVDSGAPGGGRLESDTRISQRGDAPPDSDAVFEVLVGELAGQRGELDIATEHYLRAAELSDDPRVVERAVRIAIFAKDDQGSLQAAQRWLELQPDNLEAHQVIAALYIRNGMTQPAVEHLERVIQAKEPDARQGFMLVFALLGRESNQEAAMEVMAELVARHESSPYAHFAMGHLALRADAPERALASLSEALRIKPDLTDAYVLQAQALADMGRMDAALNGMQGAVRDYPDERELRLAYARLLVEARQYEQARQQFEALHRQAPEDPDLLHTLALLSIEARRLDDAEGYLMQLRATGRRVDEAHYYLGRIEDSRRQYEKAISWYNLVMQGEYRPDAQVRVGQMLAKLGRLDEAREHMARLRERSGDPATNVRLYLAEGEILRDARLYAEAMELYDRGLVELPANSDLLYARALTAEKIGRVDWLERDIRTILEREPDNAHALNALGYTLADRTTRYEEALALIRRAMELSPDEPAIIDSMGWVQYRLGNLDEAVKYLRRAVALLPDAEIAAHLGEVLWVKGEQSEAREVWQRALEREPESQILLDVINRFQP